jgi:hypothetical protein
VDLRKLRIEGLLVVKALALLPVALPTPNKSESDGANDIVELRFEEATLAIPVEPSAPKLINVDTRLPGQKL